MARKIIDTGVVGNDGTGDSIRDSFRKVNDNFRELYSSLGLGEKLTFTGLNDTPDDYRGQNDPITKATPLVTIADDESGLTFKQLRAGDGISIKFTQPTDPNPNEIIINSEFSRISADTDPALGGDLKAFSGGEQHRIIRLVTPVSSDEAANKGYVDTKISRAGVNAIDPATGTVNAAMGRMSGPLILSRDPEPDDDTIYGGLIAATKRYVDNSAFGSVANLYVATSGQDDRPGVSKLYQGRALAYAYRTLEAALKRAEELVLEAKDEIGPYKKTLTYNNGEYECTLSSIETSPSSGAGFAADAIMSIDTVTLANGGTNYNIGDRLTLVGGDIGTTGQNAIIEVLTTVTTPGAILTYRVVTTGAYIDIPGSSNVATTVTAGSPGAGAEFNVTYKVNNVRITNPGSGYSLVSVRIEGGGGSGAFGTADVSGGQIASITVTDQGSGFTSLPTVVADLPRFKIFTNGLRTDYTGNVEDNTAQAIRTRDLREGLFLRGEESGAIAQILAHDGTLDGDDEVFDVDIKFGAFKIGETISYGDVSKNIQITILVESGIYEENYPLKVPQNTSIVGDEFRRCIIRPKKGTSSSPWAFQKFRRDLINDGLVTAVGSEFGYHYLQDSSQPVYPKIQNRGYYRAAATLLDLNRTFIQEEVIAWMNYNIANNVAPFADTFEYNQNLCKRDVGMIIDALVFDLKWGEYNRTVSAGLKYYQNASSLIAITTQKDETLAAIDYVNVLAQFVIDNVAIPTTYQDLYFQVIDNAWVAEAGTDIVINSLIGTMKDIMDGSGSVNYPKENDQMDVFLANDAVRWQAITAQGHGGFMCVLDPHGQILAKSPYAQECASFSKSINKQTFAGGMFIDGFSGNLQFQINEVLSPTRLSVGGLDRMPQLPCSFIVEDVVYRVNYVRDYVYNVAGFAYNQTKCSRDVGLIVNAILDDLIFDTNYRQLTAAFAYLRSYSSKVTTDQKLQTIAGLNKARDLILGLITDSAAESKIISSFGVVTSIINNVSPIGAPSLTFTNPTGVASGITNSAAEIVNNRTFLVAEVIGYITDNLSPAGIAGYDEATCARDVGYLLDAIAFDTYYGGNSATVTAAQAYANGSGTNILNSAEKTPTIQAFTRLKNIITYVVSGSLGWTKSTSNALTQNTAAGVGTAGTTVQSLIQIAIDVVNTGVGSLPSVVDPTYTNGANYSAFNASRSTILSNLTTVQSDVIAYLNRTFATGGSTATLVLDETTPWPYDLFTFNQELCSRDTGYVIDGLGWDIALGTNFNARKAGLTYRGANASVVIQDQKKITVAALEYAHSLASDAITGYANQQLVVETSKSTISDIVGLGAIYTPVLSMTNPPGVSSALSNAKDLILANIDFIKDEIIGWIAVNYPALAYDTTKCSRDVGYILEALAYDVLYGGNSQTRDAGLKYYSSAILGNPLQIAAGEKAATIAAIDYVRQLARLVIVNGTPGSVYSATPQITGSASDSTTQNLIDTLMSDIGDIIQNGTGAANTLVLPDLGAHAYTANNIAAKALLDVAKSGIQEKVVTYVNTNGNLYELLMPGNRSILCNDFTQVNDLGYGIFATNGGLVEAVSMFTYYCHISYYSLNGAQIRSVSGSSAHGTYALVAEGSDPLEVPTPTGLYYDLAQTVVAYAPSAGYASAAGGLFVYVTGYDYTPIGGSELEVDHGGVIYRYPVTSVVVEGLPDGVVRLNLTSDSTGNFDGLYDQILDGVKMSLRLNSQVFLSGNLAEVAVRPSTGLRLRESSDIYRVLQFDAVEDPNGPFVVNVSTTSPGNFEIRKTITSITSASIIHTSTRHGLRKGQKIIARSTSNNLINNATYYVRDVVSNTSFTVSTTPTGAAFTLVNGTGLTIAITVTHGYLENYTVSFTSTGTLPTPLAAGAFYYISAEGLTETSFRVATQKNGTPVNITAGGTGVISLIPEGVTKTTLRENYNYVDITLWQPGEFVTSGTTCTLTVGTPLVVNKTSHGFVGGETIKFETTGTLPVGITAAQWYFVLASGITSSTFRISDTPGGPALAASGTFTGTITYGLVKGRAGDSTFAVVPLSPDDTKRANNMRFNFKGEEYIITRYESEVDTNKPYGRVTLNRPLVDSIIYYPSTYTIRAGIGARTINGTGSLTIRISLTRVTSHDILEVGTGSYADTNYPNEIYGPPVNALAPQNETKERDVGRVFYVTTDQFGNFSVGPYFRVDQGTGRVTFSAAIALSNLDGIGFKRGVPIAEFSVDSSMSDNATDTVPTENATRIYIERRLGITHGGTVVAPDQLIPTMTGGFMSLDGQLGMKANMDLNNHKVINVSDPTNPLDAVNLRSLTFKNLQEITVTDSSAGDLLVFTGGGNSAVNATVIGDITFDLTPGQDSALNQVNAQINPGVIVNTDINNSAGIVQSKLSMSLATAQTSAPTGTGPEKQALNGLSSFDNVQFNVTDGWATLKDFGISLTKLNKIATKTVLGNTSVGTDNVTAVAMTDVVNLGEAVKKSQYGQNGATTGFLRRTSSGTSDGVFTTVEASTASSGFTASDVSKLIQRDSNGDFGARIADLQQLKIDGQITLDTGTTSGGGGYIKLFGYPSSGSATGSILLSGGSLETDKVTYYDNNAHIFRPQSGVGYAPITASSVQTLLLTTGGNTVNGQITGRWTLTGTSPNESRLQATYSADLAENYEGDKEYEVGTVLVFGGEKEVTTTNVKGDTRVAGVVSNTAAFAMFEGCPGLKNLVALQGRVPCKVVGKIKKGDILVTSGIPGVATAAVGDVKVGTVVGKALYDYESDHIGTVEIAVGRT